MRPFFPKRNLISRYGKGSYVAVTGSTGGIGQSLAHVFAEKGFNIVLISRSQSKLEATSENLCSKYPSIDVVTITADLSQTQEASEYERLRSQLEKIDISILINNVGLDCLDTYVNLDPEFIIKLVNVNVFAMTNLMRILGGKMQNRSKKSGIINIGSFVGEIPMSYYAVYGASKVYVKYLTSAIAPELPNIDFMVVKPSEVSTAMTHFKKQDIMTIMPIDCARGIMNDFASGLTETSGHLNHKLQEVLYLAVPTWFFRIGWRNVVLPSFLAERE